MASVVQQRVAWVDAPGPDAKIEFRQIDVPKPGAGQVLVKMEVSGVCHSDHHSIYGGTPMSTHIAGHEGVGRVIQVGSGVTDISLDSRVGVTWLHRACSSCEICKVDYTHCPQQDNSGRNVPGTFQQYCVADAAFVTPIPDQVESHIAAPVLCGGIAVYSALCKANLKKGDYVVLPGGGGGLGHLGVQIATSLGYRVIAIDAADKETVCAQSGAAHFLDFRKSTDLVADVRTLTDGYGAHAVLCIAGAPSAYDSAIPMLRNCGRLLCVGIPPPGYFLKVSPFEMLVKGLQVIGATVGNRAQMAELMDLVVQGKLRPIVQFYPFEELETVMKKLERAEISGRAVLRIE